MIFWNIYTGPIVVLIIFVLVFGGIRYVITDKQVLFKFWGLTGSCPLNQIVSVNHS